MADKYSSTLLPQTNEPEEIQRAFLDILKKLNEGWKKLKASPKFQELVKKWELK